MVILKVRRSPFTADGAAPDFSGQPELNLNQQETADTASAEADRFTHQTDSDVEHSAASDETSEKKLVVRSRMRRKSSGDGTAPEAEKKPRRQSSMRRSYNRTQEPTAVDGNNSSEDSENKLKLVINDLTRMGMHALRDLAAQYGIPHEDMVAMKKQEIIFFILKNHTENGGIIFASGALEILPDGYGFLRSPQNSYLSGSDDIYISPSRYRIRANSFTERRGTLFCLAAGRISKL